MATKGQTHQKRAREVERRERRERKQAKKEARAAGEIPATDDAEQAPADEDTETAPETAPETAYRWTGTPSTPCCALCGA